MFNLSVVSAAFAAQGEAESTFDALTAEMVTWHGAGIYPKPAEVQGAIAAGLPHLAAASIKVYASRVIQWAKSGKTPHSINQMTRSSPTPSTSGRGRPKGTGKRKGQTVTATDTKTATPTGDTWKDFLPMVRTLRARAAVLHYAADTVLPSDELARVHDALDIVLTIIGRRVK